MDMVDAIREMADEFHVIDPLVAEVRWVIVETETLVTADSLNGAFGRCDVEGNLGWMNLKGEIDV